MFAAEKVGRVLEQVRADLERLNFRLLVGGNSKAREGLFLWKRRFTTSSFCLHGLGQAGSTARVFRTTLGLERLRAWTGVGLARQFIYLITLK